MNLYGYDHSDRLDCLAGIALGIRELETFIERKAIQERDDRLAREEGFDSQHDKWRKRAQASTDRHNEMQQRNLKLGVSTWVVRNNVRYLEYAPRTDLHLYS